ncbi:protein RESPONSE TO LOW SULFUR 3-like [Phragmites australis]|uniref:protein RESPONSE TO LOW SULFUR 3-like n=1 Tax=Phragmites australis TaxID=29695 RepID=UPI002D786D95|nr:protein RESPONSE TO LOW SULFUR 3-like [Phragmites australis]
MMTRKVTMDSREPEEIKRRNAELERAAAEAAAREERLRRELEAALARLAVAEEGEERLCVQLGELEAEAVAQAVEYQEQIRALSERLAFADGALRSSGQRSVAAGVAGMD